MRLILVRLQFSDLSTIGNLYLNKVEANEWLCYTLEDKVREVEGQAVAAWKLRGITAIPKGEYEIRYTYSPRFKKYTLQLMDVPGFEGIRIHAGNRAQDTEGCILLGQDFAKDTVSRSRLAVKELEELVLPLLRKGEKVTILIS